MHDRYSHKKNTKKPVKRFINNLKQLIVDTTKNTEVNQSVNPKLYDISKITH